MAKYIAETVHKLTQKVEQDNASIQKARKTIEDLKSKSEQQIRDVYKTQDAFTKQTTKLKLAAYKNDSQYFKATSQEKMRISSQNAKAQVANIEYVTNKQIALYKEEIAWIKRLEEQKRNLTLGTTSGGATTPSTANPGGSSTQGSLGLGTSKAQEAIRTQEKLTADARAKYYADYKAQRTAARKLAQDERKEVLRSNIAARKELKGTADARTRYYQQHKAQRTQARKDSQALRKEELKASLASKKAARERKTSLEQGSVATKELNKNTHGLFATMKRALITVPAFYGVAKAIMTVHEAIGSAITRTVEFDLASRTLAAVLSGQSLMATRESVKEFTYLSTTLGGAIADYEKASLLLARSGIGDAVLNDLTKAVGITAQLSLITGESLELAASAIITFKQAYAKGADGMEAYGGALQDIGDKIAFMANASKLSLQDIGTFSNYAVAAGKAAGLTQDSLNGMAIAFSNAGNKASTIGTQIRRFTATLTSSRAGVIKLYESIGVNRTKLNNDLQKSKSGLKEDIKSSNEAFKEFVLNVAALDQVGYNQATAGMAILDKQFFDNLRNNSAEILTNVETSFNGVTGALDKTGIMADSLGKRWEAMGNKFILGTQDAANAASNFFTDTAEEFAEFIAGMQNMITFDKGEADVNLYAQDAIDEMKIGRERLNSLQQDNLTASKEQIQINTKESNIILSNINLKKREVALMKEKAAAERYSIFSGKAAGKFTNDQILNLELVRAKLEYNATVSRKASTLEIKQAEDKVDSITEAQKQLREEENTKKRLAGIDYVAGVRAKEALGYGDLSEDQQDARIAAFKKLIELNAELNLRQGTGKDEATSTKAFIDLSPEADSRARITQHINTNIAALAKYEKKIIDSADASIGTEIAQALLVLDLQKEGKHRQANIELNKLEYALSQKKTKASANLMDSVSGMKPIMGEILNYNVLDLALTKQKVQHQAKLTAESVKVKTISSNMAVEQTKLLGLQGRLTSQQVALNTAKTKHVEAIDLSNSAQDVYNNLVYKGVDLTADQVTQNKQIEDISTANTKAKEADLNVIKASSAETKALATNATAVANATLKASDNAISFSSNLRGAALAYSTMANESRVLEGKMTPYRAATLKNEEKLLNAKKAIKDIDADTVVLKGILGKTADGERVDGEARKKLEQDLKNNTIARRSALIAVGNILNDITETTQSEQITTINYDAVMAANLDKRIDAKNSVLDIGERGIASSKAELKTLEDTLKTAKKLAAVPSAGRPENLAVDKAKTALIVKQKALREEEYDLKVKSEAKLASINAKVIASSIAIAAQKRIALAIDKDMTKEAFSLEEAEIKKKKSLEAQADTTRIYNRLLAAGVITRKEAEDVYTAYSNMQKDTLEVEKDSNAVTKAITVNADAMAKAILRASDNSISLAQNLRESVTAFNTMLQTTQVLSGTMSSYNASVTQNQSSLSNARADLLAIDERTLVIQGLLTATGAKQVVSSTYRLQLEKELKDSTGKRRDAVTKIGTINNTIATRALAERKAVITHNAAMSANAEEILAAGSAVLAQKDRKVAKNKAEVKALEDSLALAKKLAAMPNTPKRDGDRGISDALKALELKKKELKNAELDLATKNAKGDTEADKHASFVIATAMKQAEINKVLIEQRAAMNGQLLTKNQLDQLNLDIAIAQKQESQIAYDAALAEQKREGTGPRTDLKVLSAKLKLEKASLDVIKKQNKAALDLAKSMKTAGGNFFDDFTTGDMKGAFAGLLNDITSEFMAPLKEAFSTLFGNLVGPLLTGLTGAFSGALSKMVGESLVASTVVGTKAAGPAVIKGAELGGWAGMAAMAAIVAALGFGVGSMGGTVSQAEIDMASGTSSFDSQGFTDSIEILNDAMQPQLTVSKSMLMHLENMDNNFGAIANALSSTPGLDLTGASFEAQIDDGIFSGSSTELLGAGLNFQEQLLSDFTAGLVDVQGFEAVLKKSNTFFGLFNSEEIVESAVDVPQSLTDDLSEALNEGIQGLLDSVEILGFDSKAIEEHINNATIDLGKLNFKDLDPEAQQQLLSDAFSAELGRVTSDAINAIVSPEYSAAIDELAKTGEDYIATITRLAVSHEYATKQFALFGQVVDDFRTSNALVDAAGGLEEFQSAMDTFISSFFTEAEQTAFQAQFLGQALGAVGLALPTTADGFRQLVLATQATSIALHDQINSLLLLADAAALSGNIIEETAIRLQIVALEMAVEDSDDQYSILMDNMGAFAGYYDGIAQAADEAAQALEDLRRSLVDIAALKGDWMAELPAAELYLKAIQDYTELSGITYSNFLDEFTKISGDGLDDDTLSDWQDLSSALQAVYDINVQMLEAELDFYDDILNRIDDAYLGSLSYLTTVEKADYAEESAARYLDLGDTTSYLDALAEQLAFEKETTTTKEEYIPLFDRYITELQAQEPESTLDDVVDELQEIQAAVADLEDAVARASYR